MRLITNYSTVTLNLLEVKTCLHYLFDDLLQHTTQSSVE